MIQVRNITGCLSHNLVKVLHEFKQKVKVYYNHIVYYYIISILLTIIIIEARVNWNLSNDETIENSGIFKQNPNITPWWDFSILLLHFNKLSFSTCFNDD